MTAVPPSLARWTAQLGDLRPELVEALGPWLPRLAAALGPLRTAPRSGAGAPDGYDGLAHRGSWERLLASEWLLAEELPEEFLRRAATGEQSFLRLARVEPSRPRRCVALFDAGPAQLGAPRLAHLALLFALDQRATEAGASLEWGVFQRPGALFTGSAGLRDLLDSRCLAEPTSDDLALHQGALELERADELWVIGGPRALELAPGRRVGVREAPRPGERLLEVRLDQRDPVVLELPEPRVGAVLLREPWAPVRLADRPVRASAVLSPSGTRVLVRWGHAIYAVGLPRDRGWRRRWSLRTWPAGVDLVAAGWVKSSPFLVLHQHDRLWVEGPPATGQRHLRHKALLLPEPDAPLELSLVPTQSRGVVFRDAADTLWLLVPEVKEPLPVLSYVRQLIQDPFGGGGIHALTRDAAWMVHHSGLHLRSGLSPGARLVDPTSEGAHRPWLLERALLEGQDTGCQPDLLCLHPPLALSTSLSGVVQERIRRSKSPPLARVPGAAVLGAHSRTELLLLLQDHHTLALQDPGGLTTLTQTPSTVLEAWHSPRRNMLVWLESCGHLCAMSVRPFGPVYRLPMEDLP